MSDGFLSRWSKRKQEQRLKSEERLKADGQTGAQNTLPPVLPAAPPALSTDTIDPTKGAENQIPLATNADEAADSNALNTSKVDDNSVELPDIETLDKESDFSPFMKEGISEELQRKALAKLWTTDPLFTAPEVLDLHMEDYTFPTTPQIVRTAWNFGQEMVKKVEEVADRIENTPGDDQIPAPETESEKGAESLALTPNESLPPKE